MSGSNQTEVSAVITAKTNGTADVKNLNNAIKDTGGSVDKLAKDTARFESELNRAIATMGKGRAGMLQYKADQLGLGDAYAPQIAKLKELEAAAAHGASGVSGITRELLVLGREGVNGNFTRMAGSLTILAQRTGLLELALSPAGLAISALAVAVGVFGVAAVEGALEAQKFNDAITLTGGYAGVTRGQLNEMADTLGKSVPGMAGKARDALSEMTETGKFTGAQMQMFGADILRVAQLSGQNTDEVVKDFAKMGDGVAKWAEEHNEKYHFLTLAEYDHITALEKAGDKMGAMKVVADSLSNSLNDQKDHVGWLMGAWQGLGDVMSGVWTTMKSIGAPTTHEQNIAAYQADIKAAQQNGGMGAHGEDPGVNARRIAYDNQQIAVEQHALKLERQAAAQKSANDQTQQAATLARDDITNLREATNQRAKMNAELERYHKDVAALAAAGSPTSAAQQAKDEADIRKKYDRKDYGTHRDPVENAYNSQLKSLTDEGVKLQGEVANLNQYGKAMDDSREAVLRWNLAHDDTLKKLSDTQKQALIAAAQKDDGLAQQAASTKERVALEDRVRALQGEADAHAKVTDLSAIAAARQEVLNNATLLGADATKQLTDALDALAAKQTARLTDQQVTEALNAGNSAYEKEIAKIKAETDALGQSNDEKRHAVVLAAQMSEAQKEIDKYGLTGANADRVRATYAQHAAGINAATDAYNDASQTGSVGMANAFNDFADKAGNQAQQVQKAWTDAFSGTEDALVKFVQTGKLNFKGLVDGVLQDIIRMEIQDAIMAPVIAGLRSLMGLGPVAVPSVASTGFGIPTTAHANGGVMTGAGPLPLAVNAYANGGIATSPQLALYGEGKNPEAYVPLPDGRTIPVTMKSGGAQAGHTFNTTVNVSSDGSASSVGPQQGQRFAEVVQQAIRQELLNQSRDGGLLSSSATGR